MLAGSLNLDVKRLFSGIEFAKVEVSNRCVADKHLDNEKFGTGLEAVVNAVRAH